MKHLLTGVAMTAALAIAAPIWAQPANPSSGGQTPYSTGAPSQEPAPSGRMSTGGRRTSGERIPSIMPGTPSASDTTSTLPPTHRHAPAHKMASHHPSRFPKVQSDNSANQLNQAELARLQQGAPPSAPPAQMQGGSSMGMPGPATGGPSSPPYSTGFPRQSEHGTVQR